MSKATISTKGHLIDAHCKYNTGIILESNGSVYDCTLNQTNISLNSNKFYIMQIIKINSGCMLFIRYGRISEVGVISYKHFSSESGAISFFEKQFKAKTGNNWSDRDNFVKKDGKYNLAEIELAEISEESDSGGSSDESDSEPELDERVISLMNLITNTTYMKNTLVQLEIDTEKMPLGKISQKQIDDAYEILNEINENLGNKSILLKLSSDFYTLIPYSCGRQKPPVIDNKKLLGKYINLLNELSQMVYGSKAVTNLKKSKGNMMKLYEDLCTEIIPLDKSDDMYQILVDYLKNSKAPTHNFKYKVLDIFEINREGERDLYDAYSKKIKNKTLLFHGTRATNVVSICQNGLICDLSRVGINVPITGKMYGLGVYASNSASKSIQYCAYDTTDDIACLFIVEFALGNMLKKKQADVTLSSKNLPKEFHSTWGMGASSFKKYDTYDDGTRIPSGKLEKISDRSDSSLLYDEFIVYHEEQMNIRYLIKIKIMNDY